MEKKKSLYWRKLDDQGKIYSLSFNKKDTSIFRLSVVLKENIEPLILQEALEMALIKYKAFKVKMRKGFFWHFFEENNKLPKISEECEYPFQKLNTDENNNYLFKVTYFETKINIDFFHPLTDGNGGIEFFKEIIYRYIELKYSNNFEGFELNNTEIIEDSENSYTKNYKKTNKKAYIPPKGYLIKGEELEYDKVGINHFNINVNEIKKHSKERNCTISAFLVAMLAYSIYETNYKLNNGKRPINVCVPISLKKYFPTKTLSNFVSYMVVSLNLECNKIYSFEDIVDMVKLEFEKKLNLEKITDTMSSNGKIVNNFFVRIVPLFLKKSLVILGSLNVKRQFTTTFSNIGKIEVDEKYKEYIKNFLVILAPDWAEKIRCGVCSYNDNLIVSFGTNLKESSIENKFKNILEEYDIEFNIEGNEVNVITN